MRYYKDWKTVIDPIMDAWAGQSRAYFSGYVKDAKERHAVWFVVKRIGEAIWREVAELERAPTADDEGRAKAAYKDPWEIDWGKCKVGRRTKERFDAVRKRQREQAEKEVVARKELRNAPRWHEARRTNENGTMLVYATQAVAVVLIRSPHSGAWCATARNETILLGVAITEETAKRKVEKMVAERWG